MFRASPFRLNMFQECPRQYKFHYIDNLKDVYGKPRPYFTMGDHVHATLKEFLSSVPSGGRSISKLEDLLREKWKRNRKGFSSIDDEKKWAEKALSQLRWFAHSQDLSVMPLMVEDYHAVELASNITLVGKIDRVDRENDGSLHIIDYKTGKMPTQINETQLHLYALILTKEQNLPVSKASYLFLDACEFRTLEPTAADLQRATSYVIELVDRILMEAEYPATPNEYCGTCDFIELCPRKEEAAKSAVGEDTLDF